MKKNLQPLDLPTTTSPKRSYPVNRLLTAALAMATFAGIRVSAQDAPSRTQPPEPAAKTAEPAKPKSFTLEAVPKNILNKNGPYLAMIGYVRNGKKGRSGIFTRPGGKPLRFKMRTDENKVEKITVDLDGDGKFDGEPEFNAPTKAEGITQTVVKNGKKIQLHLVKAGINGLALRNAQWYHGQVKVGGKVYELAVIDMDFNGVKFDGTDAYVLDANGDGKLVPWVADRETPLKEMLLLGNTPCTVAYDAKTEKLSIGEMTEMAEITLKTPFKDKDLNLLALTIVDGRYVPITIEKNTLKLPPGKYERVIIKISVMDGKKAAQRVTYYLEDFEAKLKEKKTYTLPKPIAVKPVISQAYGKISVKEELVFKDVDKTVKMASRFYSNGVSAGAPKIALYKGEKLLANGAMSYG